MAFWNKPKAPATDWETKFKQAVADLAERSEELNAAKWQIEHLESTFNQRLADAVQEYEADALAMRRKRQRDVDQKAEKRNNAAKPVARFTKPIPEPKPAEKAPAKKAAR